VSFCRHARVTGVRFCVRLRLHELTVARPLILMRSEPGLGILRASAQLLRRLGVQLVYRYWHATTQRSHSANAPQSSVGIQCVDCAPSAPTADAVQSTITLPLSRAVRDVTEGNLVYK
jgi:hypothetical protein